MKNVIILIAEHNFGQSVQCCTIYRARAQGGMISLWLPYSRRHPPPHHTGGRQRRTTQRVPHYAFNLPNKPRSHSPSYLSPYKTRCARTYCSCSTLRGSQTRVDPRSGGRSALAQRLQRHIPEHTFTTPGKLEKTSCCIETHEGNRQAFTSQYYFVGNKVYALVISQVKAHCQLLSQCIPPRHPTRRLPRSFNPSFRTQRPELCLSYDVYPSSRKDVARFEKKCTNNSHGMRNRTCPWHDLFCTPPATRVFMLSCLMIGNIAWPRWKRRVAFRARSRRL